VAGAAAGELVVVCAAAVLFHSYGLVALHCAVLLAPVIALELRALLHAPSRGDGALLAGLLLLSLTGLVYAWAPRVGAWIDHIDISHALLGVGFLLLFRAAELEEEPWTA
jgi:hypothetical protein